MVIAACAGDDSSDGALGTTAATSAPELANGDTMLDEGGLSTGTAPTEPAAGRSSATFTVTAGTEQVTVTEAEPGRRLAVYDDSGNELAAGTVDEFGALLFRHLAGGVAVTVGDRLERSDRVVTLDRNVHPAAAFYAEQRLRTDGLGYITTRDGTTLSATVWLPGSVEDGPYPTVVEYSGYTPSDPDSAGFPDLFVALGYAYVGVNIRGTGCSGGSYRYFEYAQSLDGYDAVETVAAQPWVQNHRVGMVGVSYPGISQLFVAQTQPPSLAAITPFSVIADTAISTLYPGGILNTGFAVEWANERTREAQPEGQRWSVDQIEAGDEGLCSQPAAATPEPRPVANHQGQSVLDRRARRRVGAAPVRRPDHGADVHRRGVAGRTDRRPLRHDARSVHRHRPSLRHVGERPSHRIDRAGGAATAGGVPRSVRRRADSVIGRRPRHRPAAGGRSLRHH